MIMIKFKLSEEERRQVAEKIKSDALGYIMENKQEFEDTPIAPLIAAYIKARQDLLNALTDMGVLK
jgi:hypothetical protein